MSERRLPWPEGQTPLMLAPMQGLTNRGLRGVQARLGRPDLLFTEFVRVRPGARQLIAASDLAEATTAHEGIPLVVQLIGKLDESVVEAARELVELGIEHLNLNMGCPFGRMKSELAGGGMFCHPGTVLPLLSALRPLVPGSLSVKTRAGLDDPEQILALVPLFEEGGADFLILHPRTVAQRYEGEADHAITRRLVEATSLPVIANGDVRSPGDARRVLEETGAAGLMIGRGAISDPLLFERIRGRAPARPTGQARHEEVASHLEALLEVYAGMFQGEVQIVSKLKEAVRQVDDPELQRWVGKLCRVKTLARFRERLRSGG
ncbi:MAG: tRNA-dihydrouridine synthase family protein [Deltaproteobacteria bacterium]|nr:tRNA-dihydrouridine synthase family protein [Deltaproteobacteria bacterium]